VTKTLERLPPHSASLPYGKVAFGLAGCEAGSTLLRREQKPSQLRARRLSYGKGHNRPVRKRGGATRRGKSFDNASPKGEAASNA